MRPEPAQYRGPANLIRAARFPIPDFGAARNQEGADERLESGDEVTANLESTPLPVQDTRYERP